MKTVFIVNPKAGKRKNIDKLVLDIKSAAQKLKADVEVYITKAVGDAESFVRLYCREKGSARFIACGGDGTLSEVLNGAMENEESEIGVVPTGTGNDFCRNFGREYNFSNLALQIEGKSEKCDAIFYSTEVGGVRKEGYCVNMVNIGFDCNVADMTDKIKKKTFLHSSMAYFSSIIVTLIKKKGASLKIEVDGEEKYSGRLLLTSIANGCYCGGGIKSNPLANIRDSLININIVKNMSRLKFISLLPSYMKGTALNVKRARKFISSIKCKKITITPLNSNLRICVDGEIRDAGRTDFKIVHNAFNFVLPQKVKSEERSYAQCLVR